jgi:hypothetical protein
VHLASSLKLTSVRWQAAQAQVLTVFGDTRLLAYPGRQKRGSLAKPWTVLPCKGSVCTSRHMLSVLCCPNSHLSIPHNLLTQTPDSTVLAFDTDARGWLVPTRDDIRSMYGPDVRPMAQRGQAIALCIVREIAFNLGRCVGHVHIEKQRQRIVFVGTKLRTIANCRKSGVSNVLRASAKRTAESVSRELALSINEPTASFAGIHQHSWQTT